MKRTTILSRARLVSDLHLRPERADLTNRFAAFLADTAAKKIEALFILGDLFEYWIGDDDLDAPFNSYVCGLLRSLTDSGTRLYFTAGNRDFLIGEGFALAAGMSLLEPLSILSLGQTSTLILHGDTLCTDDVQYQEFRHLVRSSAWQAEFLARSLSERRTEVEALRRQSAKAIQGKAASLMDANLDAVRDALIGAACTRLIHGHTHRPGQHRVDLGENVAERWVLSDWETGRGDALEVSAGGVRRLDLSR